MSPPSIVGGAGLHKSSPARRSPKVKEVAKSATDIFSRVPAGGAKGVAKRWDRCSGSQQASRGAPVLILAFGRVEPLVKAPRRREFRTTDRLAAPIHRQTSERRLNVLIRAKGARDAPAMMKRRRDTTLVLRMKPIW